MHKLALFALTLFTTTANANQLIVEAFYDKDTRLVNVQLAERVASVKSYDLSAPDQFEKQLSEGLSSDPTIAQKQAKERIEQHGNEIQHQLMAAYEGALIAMKYEINKIPAIVFNGGEHVIYGVNDVNKAISIYKEQVAQ
ncbi:MULTISPECIES: TIGR03757 family integrating conjugative element protein [unclassified Methylophaga]|jgi:integrating conjugative element protein (TIGR03757 family)|uniref:TIGR03757 family integrating conjugative element protein n=2 Tax=Methylophaga TaxID=40222 RepID=UPI000C4EB14B|nr:MULTISPECIES: TIGR03757 family integrating conjugative element protein [unclassified Methylophaga]MAL50915.1 TIGR03757 family integrating conjugative element protein [Methylophaga sp.]MBP26155.1 TIGR03757 family integrating conjugative element protein [Methylophaga sp.]HAD31348.1 TIGR03757 family integrating conjugative element protein [Methylophaga sp.]HCC79996.1 TIGR03757 family integrating conjugative element protein [Methylophaga sp.]|tara:strand:+ start:16286 stop:16705 length:420 start_codon:yes stop_codon:yes gene_type:complete